MNSNLLKEINEYLGTSYKRETPEKEIHPQLEQFLSILDNVKALGDFGEWITVQVLDNAENLNDNLPNCHIFDVVQDKNNGKFFTVKARKKWQNDGKINAFYTLDNDQKKYKEKLSNLPEHWQSFAVAVECDQKNNRICIYNTPIEKTFDQGKKLGIRMTSTHKEKYECLLDDTLSNWLETYQQIS